MSKSTKIAISIPKELLRGVERERRSRGEGRSAFFRRAVEAYLQRECEREDIRRYVEGYRKHPETEEELRWVEEAKKPETRAARIEKTAAALREGRKTR